MSLTTSIKLLALVSAAPTLAFWRLPCTSPIVVERADPIVQPGIVSGHVHTIMGGNAFDFTMTYNDTQASTCSSCTVHGDRSNYWTPTLYYQHQNGSFEAVEQNGGALIYYLQRGGPNNDKLQAFPEGFRMVSGDPFKRSGGVDFASQAVSYACLDYNGAARPETPGFPNYNCANGLRSQVFFPSCWDGVNLDSADHKSHMAFPIGAYNDGSCPDTHPVHLVSIFFEVIWETNAFADMWYGSGQPFVWSMGDPTGYGFHGDFLNGWDVDLLQDAVNTCTNLSGNVEDCPVFQLYPDSTAQGCKVADRVNEPILGPLDALPGCNPVQDGPSEAQIIKTCNATSVIGTGQSFFTDLTKEGWSYQGCGADNYYSRALTGASTSSSNMTNEACVEFCASEGFSVAGSEYSNQCYCANSIPTSAMPVPGVVGQCNMPCAGDATQNCGGYGLMSLYTKCTSSLCANSASLPGADGSIVGLSVSGSTSPNDSGSGGAGSATGAPSSTANPQPTGKSESSSTASGGGSGDVSSTGNSGTSSNNNNNNNENNTGDNSSGSNDDSNSSPPPSSSTQTTTTTTTSTPTPTTSPASPSTYHLPTPWTYLSCLIDTLNPRTLPHLAPYTLNNTAITSTSCVTYCSSQSYAYAGTEYGGECWCGNDIANATTASDPSECNMPCKGDTSQICGGVARLSVFTNQGSNDNETPQKRTDERTHLLQHLNVKRYVRGEAGMRK